MKRRYSVSPRECKTMTTKELRKNFLVKKLFEKDEINLHYTHDDRLILGGVQVEEKTVALPNPIELASKYFLERRELGIINIGLVGCVIVDGKEYELEHLEGLYLGIGNETVEFKGNGAKFYIASTPSHVKHSNHLIKFKDTKPAVVGSKEKSSERVIHRYVHPLVCKSSQLVMGINILKPGNVWNTMPTHIHERRTEAYMYFDVNEDEQIMHLMGTKEETRNIFVKNEQAVLSPSWSLHSGVGVSEYSFVFVLAGENQDFTDMEEIKITDLK